VCAGHKGYCPTILATSDAQVGRCCRFFLIDCANWNLLQSIRKERFTIELVEIFHVLELLLHKAAFTEKIKNLRHEVDQ
jgi:hypothetical protein